MLVPYCSQTQMAGNTLNDPENSAYMRMGDYPGFPFLFGAAIVVLALIVNIFISPEKFNTGMELRADCAENAK